MSEPEPPTVARPQTFDTEPPTLARPPQYAPAPSPDPALARGAFTPRADLPPIQEGPTTDVAPLRKSGRVSAAMSLALGIGLGAAIIAIALVIAMLTR